MVGEGVTGAQCSGTCEFGAACVLGNRILKDRRQEQLWGGSAGTWGDGTEVSRNGPHQRHTSGGAWVV